MNNYDFGKQIELDNRPIIMAPTDEKLSSAAVVDIVEMYLSGREITLLQKYDKYYEAKNSFITDKVRDKQRRDKTPNNYVPTAYYATVVDTMSGYMFSNVQYNPASAQDEDYAAEFNQVLKDNNYDNKEMKTGVHALAYNKGIEIVYTTGDGATTPEIKFSNIDPRQMVIVYNQDIEPEIFCGIRVTAAQRKGFLYNIDVIYADEWQYYQLDKNKKLTQRQDPKRLIFKECPVVVYAANDMSLHSTFEKIIQYINGLDFLITGNANDIESLTDAILVLTKVLKDEDLRHLDELKALMQVEPDERAEYLQKNTDPAFREYATKLLIQEIHKHAHVIDWYSPDTGLSGDVSAKALRTRLYDMDMYSKRIEKIYRLGSEKKVRLINTLLQAKGIKPGELNIEFIRTTPDDFEDKAPVLSGIPYLSDLTKLEMLGLDAQKEIERLDEQKDANMERFSLEMPDNMDQDDEEGEGGE
jgi:SPP1 family phage portal protein